jgi:hypothetical protein
MHIVIDAKNKSPLQIKEMVAEALKFPPHAENWDAWFEYMRDLDWLEEKDITIELVGWHDYVDLHDREHAEILRELALKTTEYWSEPNQETEQFNNFHTVEFKFSKEM